MNLKILYCPSQVQYCLCCFMLSEINVCSLFYSESVINSHTEAFCLQIFDFEDSPVKSAIFLPSDLRYS